MFKCTSAQVLIRWQSKRNSLAKEQCSLTSKIHHICGKSACKNHQKYTTWRRKIKTWHTIPLLVPTKPSRKRTFTKKMARHSATCANQFVKMISKKTHHVVAKNKIASVFALLFVAPSKHHLRNYTKCVQRTILQK